MSYQKFHMSVWTSKYKNEILTDISDVYKKVAIVQRRKMMLFLRYCLVRFFWRNTNEKWEETVNKNILFFQITFFFIIVNDIVINTYVSGIQNCVNTNRKVSYLLYITFIVMGIFLYLQNYKWKNTFSLLFRYLRKKSL